MYETLWKQYIIVSIYDDVVISKELQYGEHLLHRLCVRPLHPVYLECGLVVGKLNQVRWQILFAIWKFLDRQIEIDDIWLHSICKYGLDYLCAVPNALCPACECHYYFTVLVHVAYSFWAYLPSTARKKKRLTNQVNRLAWTSDCRHFGSCLT